MQVFDAVMANRLTKNMAEKFATKRDKSGKPAINQDDPDMLYCFIAFFLIMLYKLSCVGLSRLRFGQGWRAWTCSASWRYQRGSRGGSMRGNKFL